MDLRTEVANQIGVAVEIEPLAKLLGSRLGSVLRFSGVKTPLSWISTACSGPEGPAASQETETKGDRRVFHRASGHRWVTDAGWAPELDGRLPAARWLCHQTQELVGGERQHAEHAVAHHLRGATDPDMAATELVLETAIDALTRRTLVVANLLGTLEAEIFQAPGFGSQFLRPGLVATRVDVNQRDVAE